VSRFAFVFDLVGAHPNTYIRAKTVLNDSGWDLEQGSYYLAPEDHGLVQCMEDLHAAVVASPDFGACVRSAHLVEFTSENDVAQFLRNISSSLSP
jgi:virulence-associated protein VapD